MRGIVMTVVGLGLMGVAAGSIPPLVGFDALQPRLSEGSLRLLDARPKAEYDRAHLPGAVWVDVKAAEALSARPGGLTDRAAWQAWIDPLGLTSTTEVLVYDGGRQLDAARTWWLLGYLGVGKVGLINGNFPLWQREKRPVSDSPVKVPSVPSDQRFRVAFRDDRHATRADVLAALEAKNVKIVDARSAGEHSGAVAKAKRSGHIPSACRIEWNTLVDPDGRFLAEATLRSRFAELGAAPGTPVITHCQSGGRASVNAFVLERLGFATRNYYRGWSDWGNAEDTPVAKP